MKRFPRIYSLSTLGLRQHQEFDYRFHGFRTDFIGESGSGKSMIADLLQLIFVGSEAFKSATDAMGGKRTPDGMVLKTKDGRGTELGYAFLNIQVQEDQFIVIGAYIESSNKHTHSFVIQSGYEEEKLVPFNQPLSYANFIVDEKIPPLEDLKAHLENNDLVCSSWLHKKKFHKILFKNKILSLDLSTSDKLLNDYAAIIQSFSRGKTLDTQDKNSLKRFLFGNEKAKELLEKYQHAVNDLQAAVNDYGRNKAEIEKITLKQKSLAQLKEKLDAMEAAQFDWLTLNYAYWYQQEEESFRAVKEIVEQTVSSLHYLKTIHKILNEALNTGQIELQALQRVATSAREAYEKTFSLHEKVKLVDNWLSAYNINITALQDKYHENKIMIRRKQCLSHILSILNREGLVLYYESINWQGDAAGFIDKLHTRESHINSEVEEKRSYLQFVDINNKGSLGFWALQQRRPFSLEEESVIMHFKALATGKPANARKGAKYIPYPDNLLKDISITEPDETGFWLHLKGVREYIHFVNNQLFTNINISKIEQFFREITQDLNKRIAELETEKALVCKLRKIVINESNFAEFMIAYREREIIEKYNINSHLDISETELTSYIDIYKRKPDIKESFLQAREEQQSSAEQEFEFKNYLSQISTINTQLAATINEGKWNERAATIIDSMSKHIHITEDDSQLKTYLQNVFEKSSNKAAYIRELIDDRRKKLQTYQLSLEWDNLQNATLQKDKALQLYKSVYGAPPDLSRLENNHFEKPQREEADYQVAQKVFHHTFTEIVSTFLPNDAYKFTDVYDFAELSKSLLPQAFQNIEATEENVIDAIEKYLEKINNKNRDLNKRKLQRIKDLLDEVNDEISNRITVARRIDQFLNSEDKEITGGHRVRLNIEFSRDYPQSWINTFQIKLDEEVMNNEQAIGISEQLADSISLEEKMIAAFHLCGGHASVKPKIAKLLDPDSYIELSYTMKSAAGQTNKGSTGQTYAAIALLCIARLSLIDMQELSKDPTGVRFMPIDEAEGLGSNYDMLYHIARQFDYQIISLSINPLGKFQEGEQYIYMLHKNIELQEDVNYTPFAIFCDTDKEKLSTVDTIESV